MAMTKADLARVVYLRHGGLTYRAALRLVDLLFDLVKLHLQEGESIHIVGFGTLEVVNRKPRRGRNPITGEPIELEGHRALVFRPARSMRAMVETSAESSVRRG
jgi:nucleoid DNA-binding protein